MTEVLHQPDRDEYDYGGAAIDDRAPYEKLWAVWKGMGRRRQAAVAGGMAIVSAVGLFGGRLLFRDDSRGQALPLRPDAVAAGGVAPDGGQAAGDAPGTAKPIWEADCTDVDYQHVGNSMFVLSPKFVTKRGSANPNQTYTVVSRPTEGELDEVVSAVRWDTPGWMDTKSITVDLKRAYGVVAIAAVTFPDPDHQPQHGVIPPKLAEEFPEALVNPCAPAFPDHDGNPSALLDAVGDPY